MPILTTLTVKLDLTLSNPWSILAQLWQHLNQFVTFWEKLNVLLNTSCGRIEFGALHKCVNDLLGLEKNNDAHWVLSACLQKIDFDTTDYEPCWICCKGVTLYLDSHNTLPGFPATDLFLFVRLSLSHRHRIHTSMFFLDLESSFEIGLENRTDPRERELVCPKYLQAGYHFLNCWMCSLCCCLHAKTFLDVRRGVSSL